MDSHAWDARYTEKELVWSAEPNRFLPPLIDPLPAGTALDLGCGEGRYAIWLAREGWDVTGVDFSAAAIDKARRMAGDAHVNWVVGDITEYDADAMFDLVMIVYIHLDPQGMASLFRCARNALAPGGTLIGLGHALRNLTDGVGGPQYPEILWTEDLIRPLTNGLDVVSLTEVLRPVDGSPVDAIDVLLHATKPR